MEIKGKGTEKGMEKMKTSKFTFFCHKETVIVIKIVLHIHISEGGWRINVTGTEREVIAETRQ